LPIGALQQQHLEILGVDDHEDRLRNLKRHGLRHP
jgi:hypothetical protein